MVAQGWNLRDHMVCVTMASWFQRQLTRSRRPFSANAVDRR